MMPGTTRDTASCSVIAPAASVQVQVLPPPVESWESMEGSGPRTTADMKLCVARIRAARERASPIALSLRFTPLGAP